MSSLRTSEVECFIHPEIQGEKIDDRGLPFKQPWLKTTIPVVIGETETAFDNGIALTQTSPTHARSFEFAVQTEQDPNLTLAVWQDQYGNPFTSLNTKGNNNTRQDLLASATAPSGFIPYGLQEGDALLRVIRASRLMREAHIDTEWIVKVTEPKTIQWRNEFISQAAYKANMVDKIMADFLREADPSHPRFEEHLHEAQQAAEAVTNMDFYITVRAMRTPDRISDFFEDETAEAVEQRLARIFQVYNITAKDGDKLSVDRPEDIASYFLEVLPRLTARNLAKLHDQGLRHVFPVSGNVSALGGLVDLDSVAGPDLGFGDKPNDAELITEDLDQFLDGNDSRTKIYTLLTNLQGLGFNIPFSAYAIFCQNFIDAYLLEQTLPTLTPEQRLLYQAFIVYELRENGVEVKAELVSQVVDTFFKDAKETLKANLAITDQFELAHTIVNFLSIFAFKEFEEQLNDNISKIDDSEFIQKTIDQVVELFASDQEIKSALYNYAYEYATHEDFRVDAQVKQIVERLLPNHAPEEQENMSEALGWVVVEAVLREGFSQDHLARLDGQHYRTALHDRIMHEYANHKVAPSELIPDAIPTELRTTLAEAITGRMVRNGHMLAACSLIPNDLLSKITSRIEMVAYEPDNFTLYPEKTANEKLRLVICDGEIDGLGLPDGAENIDLINLYQCISPSSTPTYIACLFENEQAEVRLAVLDFKSI